MRYLRKKCEKCGEQVKVEKPFWKRYVYVRRHNIDTPYYKQFCFCEFDVLNNAVIIGKQ